MASSDRRPGARSRNTMSERPTTTERENGVALLAALWIVALIAALAASFAATTRTESALTRNLADRWQARHRAEAGIQIAVAQLLAGASPRAFCADGRPFKVSFEGYAIEVTVTDEGGKIDLNEAPTTLLSRLFRAVGAPADEATAIADATADWRDRDSDRRPFGAENDDYRRAGLAVGAKNAPFETIAELASVKGVTAALFERIRPHVTVHSHSPGLDPLVSTPLALAAVPGFSAETARDYVAIRTCTGPPPPPLLEAQPHFAPSAHLAYAVTATAHGDAGTTVHREAVVGINFTAGKPLLFLDWRTLSTAP